MTILEVEGLHTRFRTERGVVRAVDGISYEVGAGECVAIVGESGSGKTVQALSVLGLIGGPAGWVESGRVRLNGRDLRALSAREWEGVRGREIAMVFQDPMTSLNPVVSIGRQMTEGLRHHLGVSRAEAHQRAVELLDLVGIPDGERRMADHPHQLSGGQRQRVMIAIAISCDPAVLIADEPTTALDVTIQAQIVELVRSLRRGRGMSVVWITHDLALVAGFADRMLVMYSGTVVERASTDALFARPSHPYTAGLLGSLPRIDRDPRRASQPLPVIPGSPPDPVSVDEGCAFAGRCGLVIDRCRVERPPLLPVADGHLSACWRSSEVTRPGSFVAGAGG